jgi:hypothetical protein
MNWKVFLIKIYLPLYTLIKIKIMLAEFKEKSVYGNVLYYPHNEVATKFATLLRKKTFSYSDIFNISQRLTDEV